MEHSRRRRAEEISNYVELHGIESAISKFGISYATITRNLRRYRQLGKPNPSLPKVLLFDIETLPTWTRVWHLGKQRLHHKQIIKDWCVLSWAAKWLMSDEYLSDLLTPKEALIHDDERVCKSIWKLIDEADIIIAHNGKRFDVRKLNSRFMIHGMVPPSPYQVVDTLLHSQQLAAHSSHRLDWLGQLIRNEGKLDTDYELWIKCDEGDQESLNYMLKYNKEDVGLLEEIYLWIRPWMKSHPNIGLYMDLKEPVCSNCGSNNLHSLGYYYTSAGKYEAVRCECGAIGRQRSSVLSVKESKNLIRSIAR